MHLFLHGFLGQKEDWDPVFSHLPASLPRKAIDLPGHGDTPLSPGIVAAVHEKAKGAQTLIGYSAGGRIALSLKQKYPSQYKNLILLSTNIATLNEAEKKQRWEVDQAWIQMLQTEPFDLFLEKWYEQPLFSSLKTHPQFTKILQKRKAQNPHQMASFLERFSVARQKRLEIPQEAFFIFGKEDLKYQALYRRLLKLKQIFAADNAGHAIHLEQPKMCAEIIQGVIDDNTQV